MKYVERLLKNKTFIKELAQIDTLEQQRCYCKHDWSHLLDVSRIAYIMNLEYNLGIAKEVIYLCGLLHDIGRGREYLTGENHAEAGARLAGQILKEIECPPEYETQVLLEIRTHRQAPQADEAISRDNLFWFADKRARNCFRCEVSEDCNWSEDKKTKTIIW